MALTRSSDDVAKVAGTQWMRIAMGYHLGLILLAVEEEHRTNRTRMTPPGLTARDPAMCSRRMTPLKGETAPSDPSTGAATIYLTSLGGGVQ